MNVVMHNGNLLGKLQESKETNGLIIPNAKKYDEILIVEGDSELKDKVAYVMKGRRTDVELNNEKLTVINKHDIILIK